MAGVLIKSKRRLLT